MQCSEKGQHCWHFSARKLRGVSGCLGVIVLMRCAKSCFELSIRGGALL